LADWLGTLDVPPHVQRRLCHSPIPSNTRSVIVEMVCLDTDAPEPADWRLRISACRSGWAANIAP